MQNFEDLKSYFSKPNQTLSGILSQESFKLDKKTLGFIAVVGFYWLIMPSSLVFLMILVLPAFLINLGFLYFLSQELLIIYSSANPGKELEDNFVYRLAYCLGLIGSLPMLLSLLANLITLIFCGNLVLAAVLALFFSCIPFTVYLWQLSNFVSLLSNKTEGLVKTLEILVLSIINTVKAKFGWQALEEIREDLSTIQPAVGS